MKKTKMEVSVNPIEVKSFDLPLDGVTPLLMNKFSEEAKKEMVDKQTMTGSKEKKARDIDSEVDAAVHLLPDGRVGFPASGFKKSMVEVAPYIDGLNKKLSKGAFFIMAEDNDLVPIEFKKQVTNESVVRLSGVGRVAMVRYRPEFRDWSAKLKIRYNNSQISASQIVALANLAGFHIGVGEWTPQHSGNYGMFEVGGNGSEKV